MFALVGLPVIIANLAVNFAGRQLAKFGRETNWTQVKLDLDPRIRQILPGERLDDIAVRTGNKVIDIIQAACVDTANVDAFLKAVAAGDWTAAHAGLVALITKDAGPELGQLLASA